MVKGISAHGQICVGVNNRGRLRSDAPLSHNREVAEPESMLKYIYGAVATRAPK